MSKYMLSIVLVCLSIFFSGSNHYTDARLNTIDILEPPFFIYGPDTPIIELPEIMEDYHKNNTILEQSTQRARRENIAILKQQRIVVSQIDTIATLASIPETVPLHKVQTAKTSKDSLPAERRTLVRIWLDKILKKK